MRNIFTLFLSAGFLLAAGNAVAGHSHYTNGAGGIKAATMPGPGVYWKTYGIYYTANDRINDSGDKISMNVDAFAWANRFIYSTDIDFFGGNLLFDAIIPLVNNDIQSDPLGIDSSNFNFGDILIEPFIAAWHGKQYDVVTAFGIYFPTGKFDTHSPASPGKGFYTFMPTLGATYYFDQERTWSLSAVARYEINTRQRNTHRDIGDDFHIEWGAAKTIDKVWDVGVAGYTQWQVNADRKRDGSSGGAKEEAYAIGPEVGYTIPKWGMNIALRSLWEFDNRNATQGNITTLAIVKKF